MMVTPRTPGFMQAHITIDGQDVRGLRCFEANTDEGFISCYFYPWVLDQDGRPRAYTRYGHVVITPPETIFNALDIPAALLKEQR